MEANQPSPDDPSAIGDRPQDAYVAERLSSPSERPAKTLELSGLLGDSDRPGYRRLYFTKQLNYYAEFASADVLAVETVPKEQAPFIGLDATRVTLRRDATVSFTQVRSAAPVDEFDLDVRLAGEYGAAPSPGLMAQTREWLRCNQGPDTVILYETHDLSHMAPPCGIGGGDDRKPPGGPREPDPPGGGQPAPQPVPHPTGAGHTCAAGCEDMTLNPHICTDQR
jgi:hypothetical protein